MGRPLAVTDPSGTRTECKYDEYGSLISCIYPMGGGISYEYDSLLRPVKEKLSIGTERSFGYDGRGQLSSVVNGRGQTTSCSYDAPGRITGIFLLEDYLIIAKNTKSEFFWFICYFDNSKVEITLNDCTPSRNHSRKDVNQKCSCCSEILKIKEARYLKTGIK